MPPLDPVIVDPAEQRGHAPPLHRHDIADETFLMIEGTLRPVLEHFSLTPHTPAGFVDSPPRPGNRPCAGRIRRMAVLTGPNWRGSRRPTPIEILGPPLTL